MGLPEHVDHEGPCTSSECMKFWDAYATAWKQLKDSFDTIELAPTATLEQAGRGQKEMK